MTIDDFVHQRGISQILHFTTTSGLLGMLQTWSIKSRMQLPRDKYLEHVYSPNADIRKDADWLDYVNLSIQKINSIFFGICSNRWHVDKEWCVLAFEPEILSHPGVYFSTTNNMYSTVVRGSGLQGLLQLFAPSVKSPYSVSVRTLAHPLNEPTDRQAEVLYPRELSLDYLRNIYLSTDEQCDDLAGQLAVLRKPQLQHTVDTSIFQ